MAEQQLSGSGTFSRLIPGAGVDGTPLGATSIGYHAGGGRRRPSIRRDMAARSLWAHIHAHAGSTRFCRYKRQALKTWR